MKVKTIVAMIGVLMCGGVALVIGDAGMTDDAEAGVELQVNEELQASGNTEEAVPADTCANQTVEEFVENFQLQAVGGHNPPPCPQITTCSGGGYKCKGQNPCGATYADVDTGVQSCDTLTCPFGETVHIETGNCEQCPCCTETPACLCPSGSCGGPAIVAVFCD